MGGDLNGDCEVDLQDFSMLSFEWLNPPMKKQLSAAWKNSLWLKTGQFESFIKTIPKSIMCLFFVIM
jgi:hypothetical protein